MINAYVGMFKKWLDFSGRASRSEFWWAMLANFIVGAIISIIAGLPGVQQNYLEYLSTAYQVLVIIPVLSLWIRRLHDVGRTGWFLLWGILPVIGFVVLLIQFAKESIRADE